MRTETTIYNDDGTSKTKVEYSCFYLRLMKTLSVLFKSLKSFDALSKRESDVTKRN